MTKETYKSMQYICYGFAAMIYHLVIGKNRMIAFRRINQDSCEWHFSHIRAANGCNDNPTELACNIADLVSNLNRKIAGGVANANVKQVEMEGGSQQRKPSGSSHRRKKQRRSV